MFTLLRDVCIKYWPYTTALCLVFMSGLSVANVPNPVSHWAFEESGYSGVAAEVLDSQGLHPGTAMGGVTTGDSDPAFFVTNGHSANTGNYLVLDGTNDYVNVPFSQALNTDSFTVSLWVKSQDTNAHATPIMSRYGTGTLNGYNLYDTPGDLWEFWTGRNDTSGWFKSASTLSVDRINWQHIAMKFSATSANTNGIVNGVKSFFIDGQLIDEVTVGYSPLTAATAAPVTIGSANGALRVSGAIDEVMIFDQALDNEAIAYLAREPGLYAVEAPQNQNTTADVAFHYELPEDTFVDTRGESLSYSASGLPAGLSINPVTGTVSGTTSQIGTHTVVVTALSATSSDTKTASFDLSVATSGTANIDLSKNLVALWHLDETTALTSSGAILDASGNNLHGTGIDNGTPGTLSSVTGVSINNAVTQSTALSFTRGSDENQSPDDDDYVTMGTPEQLKFSRDFTLSTWVKPGLNNFTYSGIVGWIHDTLDVESGYSLEFRQPTSIQHSVVADSVADYDYVTITDPNDWHYVSLSFDGAYRRLYIDGVLADIQVETGNIDWSPENSATANDGFQIGRYTDDDRGYGFTGVVDEMRAYDRALSSAEILELASIPVWQHNNNTWASGSEPSAEVSSFGYTPLNTLSIADLTTDGTADPNGQLVANLSISNGLLQMDGSSSSAVIQGNNSNALTVTGSAADINTALGTLQYQGSTSGGLSKALTLSVSDGVLEDNKSFDTTVVNNTPTLTNSIADKAATEDVVFSFVVPANTFADVDAGDSLSLTASNLPDWLSFNAINNTFSGTPDNSHVGTQTITVSATDSGNLTVDDTFVLSVTNSNDAPTLANAIADQTATEGAAFSFVVPANTFTDVDAGDSLTLAASGLPTWLDFDSASNTFSGTPSFSDVGNQSITVTATDSGAATVSSTYNLSVIASVSRSVERVLAAAESSNNREENSSVLATALAALSGVPAVADSLLSELAALIARADPQPTTTAEITALVNTLLERAADHPVVFLSLEQGGVQVQQVRTDGGTVTVRTTIANPSSGHSSSFDWSLSSTELLASAAVANPTTQDISFDPAALVPGQRLIASVSVTRNNLLAQATLAVLAAPASTSIAEAQDTDGDGIRDAFEGELDASTDPSAANKLQTVQSDDQNFVMESTANVVLRLGNIARRAKRNQSSIELRDMLEHLPDTTSEHILRGLTVQNPDENTHLFDFELANLPRAGASALVVLPLQRTLSSNASYKKYHPATGWTPFVENGLNRIDSAPSLAGILGQCPAAGDPAYTAGLSAGHACVQLLIEDGGANDADYLNADGSTAVDRGLNGNIQDPGAIVYDNATPGVSSGALVTTGLKGRGVVGPLGLGLVLFWLIRRRTSCTAAVRNRNNKPQISAE